MKYYPWLDWLRFLAASMVLFGHARGFVFVPYGELDPNSQNALASIFFITTRFAHHAVLVFFVISGFLVGGRLLERLRDGSFSPKAYALDRSTRIMIPLIPVLLFTAFVQWSVGNQIDWISFFGNILSLQRVLVASFGENVPLWSLAYEVWFYVIALGFGLVFAKKSPLAGLLVCVIGLLVFTRLDSVYLFSWVIGALTYFSKKDVFSPFSTLCALVLCAYASFSISVSSESVSFPDSLLFIKDFTIPYEASVLLLALGIALLMRNLICLKPNGHRIKKIENAGTHLAAFSYTLYLLHYPILIFIENHMFSRSSSINPGSILCFVFAVSICYVVSYLHYMLFEKNTASIRRRIRAKLSF